jgi:putative oxidoreductase
MNGLMNFLDSQKANGYLILRLAAGVILAYHGYGKLFGFGISGVEGFFTSINLPAAPVLAPVVSILEFFGGLAIILGILTRLLGIWMIVQFGLIVIWVKPMLMGKGLAGDGGFEIDLMLFAAGVMLATMGPGIAALGPKFLKQRWAQ